MLTLYIQVTTKCNMECAHCGMNCTAKGENMTFKTFKKAVDMSSGMIVMGGGEPTIHPQFEKMLFYALANCEYVSIITNGKKTDTALALAKIANKDDCILGVELSQDPYHEPIDGRVVKAFESINGVFRRNTSNHLVNAGRCDFGYSDDCICDGDPFVKPNGDVYQCGCDDSPKVGNVFGTFDSIHDEDEVIEDWSCYRKYE